MFRCPAFRILLVLLSFAALPFALTAQQTLGSITGQVTDISGAAVSGASVTVVGEQTALSRSATTNNEGVYSIVNLPIGTYLITVVGQGYETQKFPGILVQADRTTTINTALKVGQVSQSVVVEATPLLNTVDTTNGYVLDKAQIDEVPLPTGSFTGLAIESPGVNAELPGGTGSNSGLGNAPIWANGQRDTSNAFLINGVDASNLFNGKSTSQVDSFRVVNNTGQANNAGGGVVPSSSSIYLSIGNAIPTPAPESVAEVRVNASMYDAQQGSDSGAHIDMSTRSGSNDLHGDAYVHRGTNWINAAPFFFKKDDNIPAADKNPQLHRYTAGGDVGGPIIKDKLFYFASYQHLHVTDQEMGDELLVVPPGLSDTNRTPQGLTQIANNNWTANEGVSGVTVNGSSWASNPVGLSLFTMPSLPGEPGKWLIPNQNATGRANIFSPYNAFLPGTAGFMADQGVANLDWNPASKDIVAAKYYYQHDPSFSPYGYSNVPGFTARMDVGSQVATINNIQTPTTTLSITETLGFIREKAYATNDQPFGPGAVGMTTAFGNYFPGITINDAIGDQFDSPSGALYGGTAPSLAIGPDAASQGANTGIFQNRIMPSATAIWTKGRHSLSFGGSWSYTQLNVRDHRTGTGNVATPDFVAFANDWVTPYSTQNFTATTYLQGNANRYFRANQTGMFAQDKFQVRPNLSITAGVRYDWDGGLTEKYGNIYNFDPKLYSYDAGTDAITTSGFVIAGNNVNGTRGESKTTLTGRQWGIAPRVGFAWQPTALHDKLVVRGGSGFYYDRGELFTYLSPGYAAGEISGGPFGSVQNEPFVSQQHCPYSASYNSANPTYLYLFYIPICGGNGITSIVDNSEYNLATPWGTVPAPPPTSPKASDLANYLPNAAAIINGAQPFTLGVYNPANKLPYSINFTLSFQYQPRNDVMVEVGYVGNLGRHEVIPVPFNQSQIATTANPTHPGGLAAQSFSYGYTVLDPNTYLPECVNDPTEANCQYGTMLNNFEGGNIDLRVPYIGYSSESESYTAAGISAYHALETHVEKRLSHGLQAGLAYTFSHTTDEQSGLGLFYNGNNPHNLHSGYGSADFDRTHVFNLTYSYTLPTLASGTALERKALGGWALNGVGILQSGQPYSVIDYSGAVGSIFYSTFDGIINPIVPLAPGCTRKNAMTGASGAFYNVNTGAGAALKASCFDIPIIQPGSMGVPRGDDFETNFINGERNIFRQTWQKRADASLAKELAISDRYNLRYTFDVYNVTNTSSFDITQNNVNQNFAFNNVPVAVSSTAQAIPGGCGTLTPTPGGLYNCPAGLGITKHTIGSPRQIQMSLHLTF